MSDTNFQPIFDYIDKSFLEIKADVLGCLRGQISEIRTSVENLTKQVEVYRAELMASLPERYKSH